MLTVWLALAVKLAVVYEPRFAPIGTGKPLLLGYAGTGLPSRGVKSCTHVMSVRCQPAGWMPGVDELRVQSPVGTSWPAGASPTTTLTLATELAPLAL